MIFLIDYDRSAGRLAGITAFADAERGTAEDARLALELSICAYRSVHEVVLLEAIDEAALRRTHGRYFETLEQLAAQGAAALSS